MNTAAKGAGAEKKDHSRLGSSFEGASKTSRAQSLSTADSMLFSVLCVGRDRKTKMPLEGTFATISSSRSCPRTRSNKRRELMCRTVVSEPVAPSVDNLRLSCSSRLRIVRRSANQAPRGNPSNRNTNSINLASSTEARRSIVKTQVHTLARLTRSGTR